MGEVYLARTTSTTAAPAGQTSPTQSLVAVKTVRQDLDLDEEFRARFRREAESAQAVRSPYTADLVDAAPDADPPWLATEYVPGPSLADAVTRVGPLPEQTVLALGADLARALVHVHAAQLLHRDLKPGNVLLGTHGPRLIDFGIAQAFGSTALTSTGLVMGTPGFMSPEHLIGSHAVVPASDVFCLGALLCFASTGHGPFEDDEVAAVVYRISMARPELTEVPESLRPLLVSCLHGMPSERPSPETLVQYLDKQIREHPEVSHTWPESIAILQAEHATAAKRCTDIADRDGATPSESAPGKYVPPSGPGRVRAKLRRPAVRAALLALIGLTMGILIAAFLPMGGPGKKKAEPADQKKSNIPQDSVRIALPDGGANHSGEFGAKTQDSARRPQGWTPWHTKVRDVSGPCSLGGSLLVCGLYDGGATAVNAGNGKRVWHQDGKVGGGNMSSTPIIANKIIYLPHEHSITAHRLRDGKKIWEDHLPVKYGVPSISIKDGILYSATSQAGKHTQFEARHATGNHKILWKKNKDVAINGRLAISDSHLYTHTDDSGLIALRTRDGEQTGRTKNAGCERFLVHKGSPMCWTSMQAGVTQFDGSSLAARRTLGAGIKPVPGADPVVGDSGVLVIADKKKGLVGVNVKSGKKEWETGNNRNNEYGSLLLQGDRLLAIEGDSINAYHVRTGSPDEQGASYERSPGGPTASLLAYGGMVFISDIASNSSSPNVMAGFAP